MLNYYLSLSICSKRLALYMPYLLDIVSVPEQVSYLSLLKDNKRFNKFPLHIRLIYDPSEF
jgi:hypothetical protein